MTTPPFRSQRLPHPAEVPPLLLGSGALPDADAVSGPSTRRWGCSPWRPSTPPEFDVTLCDENAGERVDFDTDAEIVGITGYIIQMQRVFEIADRFRALGKTVVIGGPMANLLPEECRPHCDVLFEGEAEYTWPRFLREYAAGRHCRPLPRARKDPPARLARRRGWTSSSSRYAHGIVQCTPRLPVHLRVLRHHRHVRPQDALQAGRAGAAGGRGLAQARVPAGVLRRRQFHRQPRLRQGTAAGAGRSGTPSSSTPLSFYTQASIDMVRDEELLGLLRDANFISVFLGIESPRKASLAETQKTQNEKLDLVEAVHKIQSYNLFISAGMIVGFDHDDAEHLRRAVRVPAGGADPVVMLSVLLAVPKTPLYNGCKRRAGFTTRATIRNTSARAAGRILSR